MSNRVWTSLKEDEDIEFEFFEGIVDKAFCSGGYQNVKGVGVYMWR